MSNILSISVQPDKTILVSVSVRGSGRTTIESNWDNVFSLIIRYEIKYATTFDIISIKASESLKAFSR